MPSDLGFSPRIANYEIPYPCARVIFSQGWSAENFTDRGFGIAPYSAYRPEPENGVPIKASLVVGEVNMFSVRKGNTDEKIPSLNAK